jgi:hypothetical protein
VNTLRFIDELQKGNHVYIYMLDGEFIEAVNVLDCPAWNDRWVNWIDVEDEEGDWTSINLNQITYVVPAKDKKK